MTQISAADVSKLRKMTGAGMMDCKVALTEASGDFEQAIEIIRKKGPCGGFGARRGGGPAGRSGPASTRLATLGRGPARPARAALSQPGVVDRPDAARVWAAEPGSAVVVLGSAGRR